MIKFIVKKCDKNDPDFKNVECADLNQFFDFALQTQISLNYNMNFINFSNNNASSPSYSKQMRNLETFLPKYNPNTYERNEIILKKHNFDFDNDMFGMTRINGSFISMDRMDNKEASKFHHGTYDEHKRNVIREYIISLDDEGIQHNRKINNVFVFFSDFGGGLFFLVCFSKILLFFFQGEQLIQELACSFFHKPEMYKYFYANKVDQTLVLQGK